MHTSKGGALACMYTQGNYATQDSNGICHLIDATAASARVKRGG